MLITSLVLAFGFIHPAMAADPCREAAVAGVKILCYSQGVGAFSAQERADAVARRVSDLAASRTFDPETLVVVEQDSASEIMAGDGVIANVRDGDVDHSEFRSRKEAANAALLGARRAIETSRSQSTPGALVWQIAYALLATLGMAITLVLLAKLFAGIYRAIDRERGRLVPNVSFQNYKILSADRIAEALKWITQTVRLLLTLIAIYFYVSITLSFFPATANLAPKLYGYAIDPLYALAKVAEGLLPKIFFLTVLVILTRYLLKLVKFFFAEVSRGTIQIQGFYREWADPTYKLVRLVIIAFAAVIGFPYIPGSSSPAFQGISVFLGVLVSFGSTSAIGNIVAGVVLTYMRPFQVGDRVKIADTMGDVLEKTLLVTRVNTIKNVEITIPNSMILSSHILNYSTLAATRGLVLHTTVTIGYDSPWKQIHELLLGAAKDTALVESDPAPFVLQTSLDDFYVSYQINAFTRAPNRMAQIYSDLHQNIQNRFNAAGVEIMSPHYASLRDGNEITVPAGNRAPGYEAPAFKITGGH